ncbi:MAG: methylthioribose-1-phosphate isomerase [Gammaproteobacteria bacterium]
MKVNGVVQRTIQLDPENDDRVQIIDQRLLPHQFVIRNLTSVDDIIDAIRNMMVRGAPLIGATAAWGVYLSTLKRSNFDDIKQDADRIKRARTTAVNLRWAVDRMIQCLDQTNGELRQRAKLEAEAIAAEDIEVCRQIGQQGLPLIKACYRKNPDRPVNLLTHCNAGWLATIDWGTATSPIYQAQIAGIPIHVWVDETRPRNQGASLTAWEFGQQGIDHTVIVDNAGGHIMQQGNVDLVIVGTDRTARNGDVANKIGTYLKALAAFDNNIPFYVALPSPTIDWTIEDGVTDIPIEERPADEVGKVYGLTETGLPGFVAILPEGSPVANPAFDVTPARLITGLITERGICNASESELLKLFPEFR